MTVTIQHIVQQCLLVQLENQLSITQFVLPGQAFENLCQIQDKLTCSLPPVFQHPPGPQAEVIIHARILGCCGCTWGVCNSCRSCWGRSLVPAFISKLCHALTASRSVHPRTPVITASHISVLFAAPIPSYLCNEVWSTVQCSAVQVAMTGVLRKTLIPRKIQLPSCTYRECKTETCRSTISESSSTSSESTSLQLELQKVV